MTKKVKLIVLISVVSILGLMTIISGAMLLYQLTNTSNSPLAELVGSFASAQTCPVGPDGKVGNSCACSLNSQCTSNYCGGGICQATANCISASKSCSGASGCFCGSGYTATCNHSQACGTACSSITCTANGSGPAPTGAGSGPTPTTQVTHCIPALSEFGCTSNNVVGTSCTGIPGSSCRLKAGSLSACTCIVTDDNADPTSVPTPEPTAAPTPETPIILPTIGSDTGEPITTPTLPDITAFPEPTQSDILPEITVQPTATPEVDSGDVASGSIAIINAIGTFVVLLILTILGVIAVIIFAQAAFNEPESNNQ